MIDVLGIYHAHRLLSVVCLLAAGFVLSAWLRRDRRLDKMPGPKGYPFVGIGTVLPPRAPEVLRAWGAKYGDVFKMRVGYFDWVVINSPQAFREILDKQVCFSTHEACVSFWETTDHSAFDFLVHTYIFKDSSAHGGWCAFPRHANVHLTLWPEMAGISVYSASARVKHHDSNVHSNPRI